MATSATGDQGKDAPSLEKQIEDLGITDPEALPFSLIPCTGPPEDFPDEDKDSKCSPDGAGHAHILQENVWKGRQVLRVYFINPDVLKGWKCGKKNMSIEMIMEWAGVWKPEETPSVPEFEVIPNASRADIRVQFSDKDGCWSMKGMDAAKTKKSKPTMMLNLAGPKSHPKGYNIYQRHLVIHEFGHALGLEHEHQRSDFWDTIQDFIDTDTMESDHRFEYLETEKAKKAYFGRDWLKEKPKRKDASEYKSEYDPQSIMHYWFSVQWIKNKKYHNRKAISSDTSLSDDQKKYLEGIHDRNNSYAHDPSPTDFRILEEAYA